MADVNNMYNTSLSQFMELFLISIDRAASAQLARKRIVNIIEYLTYCVYSYVQRGLFTAHKIMFALLMWVDAPLWSRADATRRCK